MKVENLPDVMESLYSHTSQASSDVMLRPSGLIRKNEGSVDFVLSVHANLCLKQIKHAVRLRKTLQLEFDDPLVVGFVSGYVFQQTSSAGRVMSSWSRDWKDDEAIPGLDLDDLRAAAVKLVEMFESLPQRGDLSADDLNYMSWVLGARLCGYVQDISQLDNVMQHLEGTTDE
jgi:hypothetical protein